MTTCSCGNYLAGIVICYKDVPGCQILVYKTFACQVLHPQCYLLREAEQQFWCIRRNDTAAMNGVLGNLNWASTCTFKWNSASLYGLLQTPLIHSILAFSILKRLQNNVPSSHLYKEFSQILFRKVLKNDHHLHKACRQKFNINNYIKYMRSKPFPILGNKLTKVLKDLSTYSTASQDIIPLNSWLQRNCAVYIRTRPSLCSYGNHRHNSNHSFLLWFHIFLNGVLSFYTVTSLVFGI